MCPNRTTGQLDGWRNQYKNAVSPILAISVFDVQPLLDMIIRGPALSGLTHLGVHPSGARKTDRTPCFSVDALWNPYRGPRRRCGMDDGLITLWGGLSNDVGRLGTRYPPASGRLESDVSQLAY